MLQSRQRTSRHLFGAPVENPADDLARQLASRYSGDRHTLSKVRAMLDELGIAYQYEMWP